MPELFDSLLNLIQAVWQVALNLLLLILPWVALIAWVAWWLLAVNWVRLRETLLKGGLIGYALFYFMMILIWGVCAPPEGGSHYLFGMTLSNFVGKTVYVTMLFVIMFVCGSVQLSGAVDRFLNFEGDDGPADDHGHGHDDHGHGDHGHGDAGHGHAAHAH